MSQAFIIEVGAVPAGIVHRPQGESIFTFISASAAFEPLDGRRFANPAAAERAARDLREAPRRDRPRPH